MVDGAIVGTTRTGTPNSFLATEKSYGDFILEFEARQSVGPTNSGVQFRSHSKPGVMQGKVHGPQLGLDPSARQWTGSLYDEAMQRWWYPGPLNPQPDLYKYIDDNKPLVTSIARKLRCRSVRSCRRHDRADTQPRIRLPTCRPSWRWLRPRSCRPAIPPQTQPWVRTALLNGVDRLIPRAENGTRRMAFLGVEPRALLSCGSSYDGVVRRSTPGKHSRR